MDPLLPDHAISFLGAGRGVPWSGAKLVTTLFQGMWGKGIVTFSGAKPAVLYTSDADTDVDGPGGSKKVDPCWENGTSLKTAAGLSLDSREFPGVVVQSGIQHLGVQLGDFTVSIWNGKIVPGQVYDVGPSRKIGENSIYLNRRLGVVRPDQSDRYAAVDGNNVNDVCTLIFPGSGPRHALSVDLIQEAALDAYHAFTKSAA